MLLAALRSLARCHARLAHRNPERRPPARPAPVSKKKLQTLFYIYKNITVAVARHEGCFVRVCVCVCGCGQSPPFCRVKCRISPDQMLYVKNATTGRFSLLQIACGPGLGGCLAAADGDGCVDCDHLGEDVQDGLCRISTMRVVLRGKVHVPWGPSCRRC